MAEQTLSEMLEQAGHTLSPKAQYIRVDSLCARGSVTTAIIPRDGYSTVHILFDHQDLAEDVRNSDYYIKTRAKSDGRRHEHQLRVGDGDPDIVEFLQNVFKARAYLDDDELYPDDIPPDDTVESTPTVYAYRFMHLPYRIKIGYTNGSVQARIEQQLRGTSMPVLSSEVEILGTWAHDKARDLEKVIHGVLKLRGNHVSGAGGSEWFNTTLDEIKSIIDMIS